MRVTVSGMIICSSFEQFKKAFLPILSSPSGRETLMTEIVKKKGKVSGVTAFDAMRRGDAAGKEVVDAYIGYLACGLTNMVNIFQPQVISLGGGVSNEGQSLIEAILPLIRKEQYGGNFEPLTDIRIAKLGNDAGIIGAAALSVKV